MQISYLRVSTARQGESGLGLEAQRAAVRGFLGAEPDAEFVEIESGKMANRPQLLAAMAECKRFKARLVVAKLDRLTRNLHFLTGLIDSKIDFVAVDSPHANKLTLHILGAVAESERDAISARTKAALQAAKARGQKLGGAADSHPSRHLRQERLAALWPKLTEWVESGVSIRGMACRLGVSRTVAHRLVKDLEILTCRDGNCPGRFPREGATLCGLGRPIALMGVPVVLLRAAMFRSGAGSILAL
jgi:DNA invertase Pin-like site-specific DNA recombinase